MAEAMLSISNLPKDIQEEILEGMSVECADLVSIEINGEVFMIPKEVHELIDNLVRQISNPKESIAKEAH